MNMIVHKLVNSVVKISVGWLDNHPSAVSEDLSAIFYRKIHQKQPNGYE